MPVIVFSPAPIPRRLQRLDERLMERSRHTRSRALDRSLVALTQAASYSKLWLLLAGGLAICGGPRGRRAAGHGVGAIGVAAAIANGPAKLLANRHRPVGGLGPTLIDMPFSTSFPSGHSASAFAFATGASSQLPVLAPLLIPLAGAVAYSRVHVGVHYPSDVIGGMAIGIGSAVIAGRLGAPRRCRIPLLR